MTGNEALKLIYDLTKENSEKLDAKTIFLLGEAVGTLERIIDKKIEELEKKAEYDRGYKDGTKAKDGERGSIYYGGYGDGLKDGYEKGLKHGQELRAKETECAEACGMRRACEAARKIVLSKADGGLSLIEIHEIFDESGYHSILKKFSASEVIEKIETWEKKQEQTEKNCKECEVYSKASSGKLTVKEIEKCCGTCKFKKKRLCKCVHFLDCVDNSKWQPKEQMRVATPEESKSVDNYIKSISRETGVTFQGANEQTEKKCENCYYYTYSAEKFPCSFCHTKIDFYSNWKPREKQDAPEDDVKVGDTVRTLKDKTIPGAVLFPIGTIGKVDAIELTSGYPYKVVANGRYWWYSRDMFEVIKKDTPETNVGNIEVGDECICNCPNEQKVVVTAVLEHKDQEPWVTIMRKDGACYSKSSKGLTKTGNHYGIQSILDAMKG